MPPRTSPILLFALLVLVILLSGPGAARANWIGGVVLDHGTRSHLGHGEHAGFTCDFKVTNPDGAFLASVGYHAGVEVPGVTTGIALVQPAGTVGSTGNYFSYGTGDVVVDEYRIIMRDPVSSEILLEMRIPVDYRFGPHAVNGITMSAASPGWIRHGDNLVVDFAYQTDEVAGVRVGARPFTGGVLTPGYFASGLPLLPVGDGVGSQSFGFNGDAEVDEIRIQMLTADQSMVLQEFFVPVDLRWTPEGFTNITFDPAPGSCLAWGEDLVIEFDYASSDPAGCFLGAVVLDANGEVIPGQDIPLTSDVPASGHVARSVGFPPAVGEGEVASVRLIMRDHAAAVELQTVDLPVAYSFGPDAVRNVTFFPSPPAVLDLGEQVATTFQYRTAEPAGIRISGQPYTFGSATPGSAISGSPLYTGTGNGVGNFTVNIGNARVSGFQMEIWDDSGLDLLKTCDLDVDFTFGGVGGVTAAPELPPATEVVLGRVFPNPFNPVTNIPVDRAAPGRVVLNVYDLRGRLVRRLADRIMPAGRTVVPFSGEDLPSGTYFCALESPGGRQVRRMMLLK